MTPFVDTKECEEVSDEYVNEIIANLYEGDNGDTLDVSPPAPNGNREGDADVDVDLLK